MSHTIYDLKYHFAELGNKGRGWIVTRNVEVEQIQVRKWAASCSKIFQVSRLKVLIDRLVLLGGKCIFGKMMRLSSSHLIFIPMWCWCKESIILSMNVRSHLRMLAIMISPTIKRLIIESTMDSFVMQLWILLGRTTDRPGKIFLQRPRSYSCKAVLLGLLS